MKVSYINELYDLSQKSDVKSAKHSCIIVKQGKIVGRGWNYKGTTSRSIRYYTLTVHAEAHVILKKKKWTNCDLYVFRFNNQGETLNSKPCDTCSLLIQRAGIKNVYYSDEHGGVSRWRLK
tara:strand:- start:504 stop:866 length:363 start_codon:yes stop_codon:yes gene_type:complete